MRIHQGTVIAAALALMLASPPLIAQRGGRQTPARPDTAKKPASASLDYQDQELKVVLDALAAAGDLNVSMTNIPSQRITVHMGRPVDREGMIEVLKNVSEANGLKFTQTPSLIQISGTPPERNTGPTPQQILQQQLAQANQQQQVRLFTYRLRRQQWLHADIHPGPHHRCGEPGHGCQHRSRHVLPRDLDAGGRQDHDQRRRQQLEDHHLQPED